MKHITLTRREWLRGCALLLSSLGSSRILEGATPAGPSIPLKVGIAETTITPSWSTQLWGYGGLSRYSTGALSDLFAKAFLFDWGKRFLVITMDLGAIGFPLRRRIGHKISKAIKIDEDAIQLNVTHDHSAPAVIPLGTMPADPRFHDFLEDKLVMLAKAAMQGLAPATLEYGHVDSFIGLNRRVGDRANTWNKDSGPIESTFSVLLVKSPEGKNRGVIVNYPTHPVSLRPDNVKISPDFPGVLYRELGKSVGCPVAYMQGCCGDMIPKVFGTQTEMEEYGKKMAEEAQRALAVAKPVGGSGLDYRSERVLLTFVSPYTLDELHARYAELTQKGGEEEDWAERLLRYLEDGGDMRQSRDTMVQALRLGDLSIAILPGEVLHLTAQLIRKDFPNQNLMIAAYSNDTSTGYLPHADEFPKGGYEVATAWKYYSTLRTTPDMERAIRETSERLLQSLLDSPAGSSRSQSQAGS
jgi:neutral ceramidase